MWCASGCAALRSRSRQLPLLTMIGVRHSIVCGRVSLRKVAVEWVTWFTIFFQRAPSEEELITHAWPAPTIRRLGVLDRKLRGAKFSANYTASGGLYGLHLGNDGTTHGDSEVGRDAHVMQARRCASE